MQKCIGKDEGKSCIHEGIHPYYVGVEKYPKFWVCDRHKIMIDLGLCSMGVKAEKV